MKNKIKAFLFILLVVLVVTAAFIAGGLAGRSRGINTQNPADSQNTDSSSQPDSADTERVSDCIFNLVTAFENYTKAASQHAYVKVKFGFGSLDIDEQFSVTSGTVDDMQVSHLKRGKLDIYICDGKVFVEDDDARFGINNSDKYNVDMRQVFAFAYEVIQNGDFAVSTNENKTVYSLTLTQQQIENILNAFQNTMDDFNVKVEKGVLTITLKDGNLDSFEIDCSGYTKILTAKIDGNIYVKADLSVLQQPVSVPQSIAEQIK